MPGASLAPGIRLFATPLDIHPGYGCRSRHLFTRKAWRSAQRDVGSLLWGRFLQCYTRGCCLAAILHALGPSGTCLAAIDRVLSGAPDALRGPRRVEGRGSYKTTGSTLCPVQFR